MNLRLIRTIGLFAILTGILQLAPGPCAAGAEPTAALPAHTHWWHTYTSLATLGGAQPQSLDVIRAGAVRSVGTLGWYGFWFLDSQEQSGHIATVQKKVAQVGARKILYYDLGEVGDYAVFIDADGKLKSNGWSLPFYKGKEPLTARWFGLAAFMQDAAWAPYPSARAYALPAFTMPDGRPADDLYALLSRRKLDGTWHFDFSSNPKVTDEMARLSGLDKLAQRQAGKSEVQGKTGWQTVRLIDVDVANPQLRDYMCREIERIIPRLRPDGIHADNFGDANLGYANQSAFGLWSVHTFRQFMRNSFTREQLAAMGIADIETFDIAAYVNEKPFESRGKAWQFLNRRWATDPVWNAYALNLMQRALDYHRTFFAAAKKSAAREKLDCAVFGNTIPLPLGGSLLKGTCDVAHFEWSTVHSWWGMRPMGLPPQGRSGYVVRLGAAMSDAGYCWPSIYVKQDQTGPGHENLHKALAFDCLANHGLLDFGHGYRDGYSPGTPASAGFVNRFVSAHARTLSQRRYLADVAIVHSGWSEVASATVFNPVMDLFVDEYCGWAQYLGDTHRQWDVLLQHDLSAESLQRYPIVVLPSVLVLTDEQIALLRRYLASGGRIVATGHSGTRYGPERFLGVREKPLELPGARITSEKPGVTYWRKDRDDAAGRRMAELLTWEGHAPRIATAAPPTVGVNLHEGRDLAAPLLTLDLNNCDLDVSTDALRPAPAFATTIRLPDSWRQRGVRVSCSTPENVANAPAGAAPGAEVVLNGDHVKFNPQDGTITVNTPEFSTYLLLIIRPEAR